MSIEEIKAELEAAKAEANAERLAREAAEAKTTALETQIKSGNTKLPIKGSFKGYKFDDGHGRVRNDRGELCDTEKLLAAAADNKSTDHEEAVKTLEWFIKVQYAHFTKK